MNLIKIEKQFPRWALLLVLVTSGLLHVQHFGKDLVSVHVWRQTQTQNTINNFYEEDGNLLNPRQNNRGNGPGYHRMEFPLMQWIIGHSYFIFGQHIPVTRIWMFLFSLLTVWGIYKMLYYLFLSQWLASIGCWMFTFSPVFFYHSINPLPDIFALMCSVWGLAFFLKWYRKRNTWALLVSGSFLALGAACKLPFILYFVLPGGYFLLQILFSKQESRNRSFGFGLIYLFCLILPIAWYAWVIPQWESNIVLRGMMDNQESWKQIFDYLQQYLISTLPEMLLNFAAVPLFIAGFYFLFKRKAYQNALFGSVLLLSLAILGYFFFELNAMAGVHDYYLLPFLPLLFMLVGYGGRTLWCGMDQRKKYAVLVCLIVAPITCYIRMYDRWDTESPGFNNNLLLHKEELQNAVPDDALVVAGNDISTHIWLYYLHKKGWTFDQDLCSTKALENQINKGAKYLYTDSETVAQKALEQGFIKRLILQKGTIKVYEFHSE